MLFADFAAPSGVLSIADVGAPQGIEIVPPIVTPDLPPFQHNSSTLLDIVLPDTPPLPPRPSLQSCALFNLAIDMIGRDHPTPPSSVEGRTTLNLLPPPFPTPPPKLI